VIPYYDSAVLRVVGIVQGEGSQRAGIALADAENKSREREEDLCQSAARR
jgi:hypothetical protein